MRSVTYKVMPAIGGSNTTKKHGTLLDLVLAIPIFRYVVPPRHPLNSMLRRGVYDAGMSGGCIWRPFEIDETEYNELVEELITLPHREIAVDTRFSECTDFDDWYRTRFSARRNEHSTL